MDWSSLMPKVSEEYAGPKVPFYFLILIAVVNTVRSLIHIFAADGGAHSIAGIAVNIASDANLVALFAQWGVSQLVLALFYWAAILRYRYLAPAMLLVVCLEQLLRIGAGSVKPLVVAAPPPGAIGSQIVLALSVVALIWSLWPTTKRH